MIKDVWREKKENLEKIINLLFDKISRNYKKNKNWK